MAFLVFETDEGLLAAVVDEVISVTEMKPDSIDTKPNIITAIPADYLLGVGRHNNMMVLLVDLRKTLSRTSLLSVMNEKLR